MALSLPGALYATPVTYNLVVFGTNAGNGYPELLGPVVQWGGKTYGGTGKEIEVTFTFSGDTADVQPWAIYGTSGYEIRRGVASVLIQDPATSAVLAQGVFDSSAGIFVSVDNGNGGIGFGSLAVWPVSASGVGGQVAYPFAKVISNDPLAPTYDLRSNYQSYAAPNSTANGLGYACPGFPGSCAQPIALPMSDGSLFSISVPTPSPGNFFTTNVDGLVGFSSLGVKANFQGATFSLSGRFALGKSSNGINPAQEPVTLVVNGYPVLLPAGSFTEWPSAPGQYKFVGVVNGSPMQITIAPAGFASYSFTAQGTGTNLGPKPTSFSLTIGGDTGTAVPNRN